jgi:hypothetical protein
MKAKQWTAPFSNGESTKIPSKAQTWTTVTYIVKESADSSGKGKVPLASILIDGKLLGDNRTFPGIWNHIGIQAKVGQIVVSGIELIAE